MSWSEDECILRINLIIFPGLIFQTSQQYCIWLRDFVKLGIESAATVLGYAFVFNILIEKISLKATFVNWTVYK